MSQAAPPCGSILRAIAESRGGCENATVLNAVEFYGRSTWRERSFSAWVALSRSLPRIRGKVRLGLALYRALHLGASSGKASSTLFEERLLFHLNLGSLHERMALLMNGYEDETTSMLADLYTGGTILDIGANIGLVGLPLAVRTRARASDGFQELGTPPA